jgi:hypothetical protein
VYINHASLNKDILYFSKLTRDFQNDSKFARLAAKVARYK